MTAATGAAELASPEMLRLLQAAGFKPVVNGYPWPVFEHLRETRRYVLYSAAHRPIEDKQHRVTVHAIERASGVRITRPVTESTPLIRAIERVLRFETWCPPLECAGGGGEPDAPPTRLPSDESADESAAGSSPPPVRTLFPQEVRS